MKYTPEQLQQWIDSRDRQLVGCRCRYTKESLRREIRNLSEQLKQVQSDTGGLELQAPTFDPAIYED